MKILVTGGCGFIGANLIHFLLRNTPHSVVNLDKLTYAGNPHSLAGLAESDKYDFVQGDIADVEFGAEAVNRSSAGRGDAFSCGVPR